MTKAGSTRTSLIERLVNKAGGVRSEATIQSDVRMLLLDPELGLDDDDLEVHLEAQVGPGRRIDVEIGCTVIEVKKSLASPSTIAAATTQLAGYVQTRAQEMGRRYVGILTDGRLRRRTGRERLELPAQQPAGHREHRRRALPQHGGP